MSEQETHERGELLTVEEAAELLGCWVQTVHAWAAEGQFPFERQGRRRMFRRGDLERFKESKKPLDLTGQTFGRLTVLGRVRVRYSHGRRWRWLCQCECGRRTRVSTSHLLNGKTKSCACLRNAPEALQARTKRKYPVAASSDSREYAIYKNITQRCGNPNNPQFDQYGGRGLRMCSGWRADFMSFYEDMGPRPSPRHSVDRIDGDRGYECGHCEDCVSRGLDTPNCRWATPEEQSRNMSRNVYLTFEGETLTLTDWARRIGIATASLKWRIEQGWPPERVFGERRYARQYTHDGLTLTLREWAARLDIPFGTLAARLQKGWSVKRTLSTPLKGPKITYRGERLTAAEWGARLGMTEAGILSRLKMGWSIKKAVTTPPNRKRART